MEHLAIVSRILRTGPGYLLDPLADRPAIWSLIWVSILTAILALFIYRLFSSPEAIRGAKRLVKAHILEMRLFQEDPVLMGRAIRSMVGANLAYMRLHLKPLLVMLLPVLVLLVHAEARFGYRPFLPGEKILVRSFWKTDLQAGNGRAYELFPGEGLELESPPLRLAVDREVHWRLSARATGNLRLTLKGPDRTYSGNVRVSDQLLPVSRKAVAKDTWQALVDPAAVSLPGRGDLIAVEVEYPRRLWGIAGHRVEWIWLFLLFSIGAGYALKGLFRVQL